jgi:hypothetical protein
MTDADLQAMEFAYAQLPAGADAYDDQDMLAVSEILLYLPRLIAAARAANTMREQLAQALAWLDAWRDGADLSEIENFGLKGERLLEFTNQARTLLAPTPAHSRPISTPQEPTLP